MIETGNAFFRLDAPAEGETPPAGLVACRGWLVAKPGHHFVDLRARVGGRTVPVVYGLPRRDLATQFHARESHLLAGFAQALPLVAGPNPVAFEACTLAGEWVAVHSLVLVASSAAEAVSANPPHSPLRAIEFARALHLLLRRAGGETHPDWSTLATELAAALPHPVCTHCAAAPFRSHFDEPTALAQERFGRVALRGWLFHETAPIRRVFGTFDLQTIQELQSAESSSIPAPLAAFRQADTSGWSGFLDTPAQLPQPRCLRLYAELTNGSWHLCHVRHTLLWGVETEKRGYPRYSRTGFLHAALALRSALRRRHIPIEGLRTLLPELRPVWHAFQALAPRRGPSLGGLSGDQSTAVHEQAQPRRLLLISHNLALEGPALFLAELAAHCRRSGLPEITVIAGHDGPLRRRYEQLAATVRLVDLAPLARAATPVAQRHALRALMREVDFTTCDLVVANTLTSYWAVHAARAAHRPSLLYIHESTTPAAFFPGRSPAALPGIEQALAAATRVSFLTAATRRYYSAFSDGANYRLTPGWIDLRSIDAVRTGRSRDELRRRLGLAPEERLVINLGTVCARKGQILFARAVDLLCRRHPPARRVRFLMVGGRDTEYDRALAAQLVSLGRPNLLVAPEAEDTAAYYGAADLFVCSSFEESFPRVILEAMAFTLPIVSSAVHGVPEIVRHDEEALLVPPGDTWALAEAMEQVLAQPAWAAQLGQRARRRLEQTFTGERVLPLHLALAREAAAGHI
ncbi:MAG: glycosyltransferase family 4 protein [Opitutaceae bacterium]|nr:glycosyltransferase family 4 protein [Opitutaceae bacterium]